MEVKEFTCEITFPLCEHKEKIILTAKNGKRGIEEVYNRIVEQRNGLCGKCYREL